MHSHELHSMNEQEFDTLLEENLPSLPPDAITTEVTPWRESMNRILVGLALTNFTLNIFLLQYILPTIGYIQLLRGWRTLRRENRWFRTGWLISIPLACIWFFTIVLNATIWQEVFYDLPVSSVISWSAVALKFATCFCLWGGFRAVQRKAGQPPHAGAATALMVWYVIICVLGLGQYSGWLLGLPVIIAYICIIRSLYRLSKELDEAGYAIEAAPVRISDGALVKLIAAILAVGILCGYLFLNRYPMDWAAVEATETAEQAKIKAHLKELSFPEDILDDLTAEDLAACEGALRVAAETEEHNFDGARKTLEQKEFLTTNIAVELPGDQEHWKIFHQFRWQVDQKFYGTEAIHLWPAYQNNDGWQPTGTITGQVLHERAGQTFAAAYYALENETYTSNNIFWGEQTSTDVFAAYSMPRNGENCRGYVSYDMLETQDGYIVNAWSNYIHQTYWAQYPVQSAKEYRKSGAWFTDASFGLHQTALQFHPTETDLNTLN